VKILDLDYGINKYKNKIIKLSTNKSRVQLVLENLNGKILDVGCDHSSLHKIIYNTFNGNVFGIDVKLRLYKKFPKILKASAEGIPYNDNSFDCVFAGEVIEHLNHPEMFLRETYRILRKQGKLVLTTPNKNSWINLLFKTLETYDLPLGHRILFTKNSLLELATSLFRLKYFTYFVGDELSLTGHESTLNNEFTFGLRRIINRIIPNYFKEGMFFVFEVKK
jgi:ubiquinone/menaquinone biosynthesis C-methylase UbiE